jgi:hypothetical protein
VDIDDVRRAVDPVLRSGVIIVRASHERLSQTSGAKAERGEMDPHSW